MTAVAKKKRKKLRLKSSFKRFLVFFIFFVAVFVYAVKESYKIYQDYKYKETFEYKLTVVGYSEKEIKKLLEVLDEERINNLINSEYSDVYFNIVNQKYYLDKYYDKYIDYKNYHEDVSYEDTIAIVNVHANEGWYNVSFETDLSKENLILVNKFYHLASDFVRDDIENVSLQYAYSGQRASSIVIEKFLEMRNDIKNELEVNLMVNSSYRPYKEQEEIYDQYKKVSLKYADSYAARPGYSEHQTGLAIDITSLEHPLAKDFKESVEYEWLKNNCYKYGFILRYPENKEHITGYSTESWHFRYVGYNVAKQIYEEGITFDEYYAYYVEK